MDHGFYEWYQFCFPQPLLSLCWHVARYQRRLLHKESARRPEERVSSLVLREEQEEVDLKIQFKTQGNGGRRE